jgi:hypothetical protein
MGPTFTAAKAKVAALGVTLTAATTALAAVQVALDDGALDFTEYGTIVTALATAGATIYAVWRTPNREKL